jgi:hypothetical protein
MDAAREREHRGEDITSTPRHDNRDAVFTTGVATAETSYGINYIICFFLSLLVCHILLHVFILLVLLVLLQSFVSSINFLNNLIRLLRSPRNARLEMERIIRVPMHKGLGCIIAPLHIAV